jgi:hypothetical protein
MFSRGKPILWLRGRTQRDENSASELGYEVLADKEFELVPTPVNPFRWMRLLYLAKVQDVQIYYQFADPISNLWVALAILMRVPVTCHYLDNIIGGYPPAARRFGLHIPIMAILKYSRNCVAVSKPMKALISAETGRSGPIAIRFRTKPDAAMQLGSDAPLTFPAGVCYFGAINRKTNLSAILEASELLQKSGLTLYVYTRTHDETVLSQLQNAPLQLLKEVAAKEVVALSRLYVAQLLPFNFDEASFAFYKTSTPSKIPNLLMARRPLIYFGPHSFWLFDWLSSQPGLMHELGSETFSFANLQYDLPETVARSMYDDFCSLESWSKC